MSWRREDLSPEEREEYDLLIEEAGFDEDGTERPSGEIGERMHDLLVDADQAGRVWASYILRDDAEAGHLKRFNSWNKARKRKMVYFNGQIVPKAAVVGVRRKRDDGSTYHQQSLWELLTWAEVEQKLDEARSQKRSAAINETTAKRLLALRIKVPNSIGPLAACDALGIDLDEYLQSGEDAA